MALVEQGVAAFDQVAVGSARMYWAAVAGCLTLVGLVVAQQVQQVFLVRITRTRNADTRPMKPARTDGMLTIWPLLA